MGRRSRCVSATPEPHTSHTHVQGRRASPSTSCFILLLPSRSLARVAVPSSGCAGKSEDGNIPVDASMARRSRNVGWRYDGHAVLCYKGSSSTGQICSLRKLLISTSLPIQQLSRVTSQRRTTDRLALFVCRSPCNLQSFGGGQFPSPHQLLTQEVLCIALNPLGWHIGLPPSLSFLPPSDTSPHTFSCTFSAASTSTALQHSAHIHFHSFKCIKLSIHSLSPLIRQPNLLKCSTFKPPSRPSRQTIPPPTHQESLPVEAYDSHAQLTPPEICDP